MQIRTSSHGLVDLDVKGEGDSGSSSSKLTPSCKWPITADFNGARLLDHRWLSVVVRMVVHGVSAQFMV